MLDKTAAVILAAGQGTRMRSALPKVVHPVLGRPLVEFPVRLARTLGLERTVVVVGHGRALVEAAVRRADEAACFAVQTEQRGTADAVKAAREAVSDSEWVLILSGDVPGLLAETVLEMAAAARTAPLVVLAFEPADPTGYGRMVVADGALAAIVEHRDASPEQRAIGQVNAGIYLVRQERLFEALDGVGSDNAQGEFYLTDIVAAFAAQGSPGTMLVVPEFEVSGVNDRSQLAAIGKRLQAARNLALMRAGVTLLDPDRTVVGLGWELATDVTLHADVTLRGDGKVGTGTTIMQGAVLEDVVVGQGALIKPYCVLAQSKVGDGAQVGPFAHLRPGTELMARAKVGNFVEIKKTRLGEGSKASHLTYLGDADIGRDVNIGAGTITCNYDGVGKHRTVIEDRVFVGSNTEIVAPAVLGAECVVGAGTTVTRDVPPMGLVVSRVPQKVIEGWAARRGPVARKRKQLAEEAAGSGEAAGLGEAAGSGEAEG